MPLSPRALALVGAAMVAALAVAGCSTSGHSGNSAPVLVSGDRLTIVISEPSNYESDPVAQDVVEAEQLAFDAHSGEVTHYKLGLVQARGAVVSDNARAAIQLPSAIAYIGEIAPGASDGTVGITNAENLLELSPTDTALELAQTTPAVSGAPNTFFQDYSTYGVTFAREVPTSAQEAKAQVAEMAELKLGSVYVGDDGSDYGAAVADAVRSDAHGAGLTVSTDEQSAGAIFYGAQSPRAAAKFFNAAATSNPSAKLFGTSSLDTPLFTGVLSPSIKNLYVTTPGFMPNDLNASGKGFVSKFTEAYHHKPAGEAIFGFEAMTALIADLKALGGAADNRGDVAKEFLRTNESTSVLGPYKINDRGNTSLDAFVWNKFSDGALVPFKAAS